MMSLIHKENYKLYSSATYGIMLSIYIFMKIKTNKRILNGVISAKLLLTDSSLIRIYKAKILVEYTF